VDHDQYDLCWSPTAWAATAPANRRAPLAVVAVEQFTLNTFKRSFDSNGPEAQRVLTQFRMALRQADARILEESADHPELSGMGTTVTMAYHLDAQLCVVHVGDSRAYMFAADKLTQVTHDHTLMAEPEAACTKLLAQANDAGGPDNITVLIVRFDPADDA
jgi:serine/threonine protein phosphatase PrpC